VMNIADDDQVSAVALVVEDQDAADLSGDEVVAEDALPLDDGAPEGSTDGDGAADSD
jgi:hypothetical protein